MADPASWDLLDEDCSDISDWTDEDIINGISEVSPAGQFHLYNTAGGSPVDNSIAQISRDIGTFPDTVTYEIKTYFDTLGTTEAGGNNFYLEQVYWDNARFAFQFKSDGLFVYDGAAYNEVGTDLVKYGGSAAWQTWRFLITMTTPSSATCDVYLDSVLQASGVDCSATGTYTDGLIRKWMYAWDLATESHTEWIKIATGLYTPPEGIIAKGNAFKFNRKHILGGF